MRRDGDPVQLRAGSRVQLCKEASELVCAQLAVGLWREDFTCAVIQWDSYSSCVKIRCQETDSVDCNRLRTLVLCNSEVESVEISDNAVNTCSYELSV
jgi:hypothetical protein